jgi:hypothetical protein
MEVTVKRFVPLAAALALAGAGTAGAVSPVAPTSNLAAAPGCTLQCVSTALVTPTASGASVFVRTTVAASVTVVVTRADRPTITSGGSGQPHVSVPPFLTERTIEVPGLEPETDYRIEVRARDLGGRTAARVGTFRTRPVTVAVDTPTTDLHAGQGCAAGCITSGVARAHSAIPGRIDLEVRTSVPARIVVEVIRRGPSQRPILWRVAESGHAVTRFAPVVEDLPYGARLEIVAHAVDANGRRAVRRGSVVTRRVDAVVRFAKLHITEDGDWGPNRGELAFWYLVNNAEPTASRYARYRSPTVITAPGGDGITRFRVPLSGPTAPLTLLVAAEECDWAILSNCLLEASGPTSGAAHASGRYTRRGLLTPGALPPLYGTGVTLPFGHDAYVWFDSSGGEARFRAFATVDFEVAG